MDNTLYDAVDEYINQRLVGADPALDDAVTASDAAGLPAIQVAPNQGKLLQLLARAIGARRVLEVGTLGGYSTIWLARALPADGRLVSLEVESRHADVARSNIERAGLSNVVEVRLGPALEFLAQLQAAGEPAFDLTFIDADKATTTEYFDWAVRLSHPGSLVIVDNVVRQGAVIDEGNSDASAAGMRRFFDALAHSELVDSTAIQTVGVKGHDGLSISLVR